MRTQAHRIVDTDPKRGNVVVRVTGTRHDEPTYQVRQSLPNTQEVPGHDHHTNRVRETGSGSHGPILRSVPTNRLSQHLDRSSGSRHDRTLEGHESARARGKSIGGAAVTDEAMLAVALHLRGQERSLRDIAARLVIATGKKKGQHPSSATVMRMLREHDEKTAAASVVA